MSEQGLVEVGINKHEITSPPAMNFSSVLSFVVELILGVNGHVAFDLSPLPSPGPFQPLLDSLIWSSY